MARDEKSSVEKLKDRLYARGTVGKEVFEERAPLSPTDAEAPVSWPDSKVEPPPEPPVKVPVGFEQPPPTVVSLELPVLPKHMSFATKFFLGSMIFFVGAIALSAVLFFGGVNTTSPQNIDVQLIVPSLIDEG